MKTSHLSRNLVLTLFCAVLAACTDSSVTAVKSASMPPSELTFGELLDSPSGCTSAKWAHADEKNSDTVVQYTCSAEISTALIEFARTDNTDRIRAMMKGLDESWKRAFKTLESGKAGASMALVQASKNKEIKIKQGQMQLQEAQARLNRALASSPQNYIGHGPSGYTSQLIAMGKERMQLEIQSAMKEVEVARYKIEEKESGRSEPGDPARQHPGLAQDRSVAEYQASIDGMLSWKDRYYAAISEYETAEIRKAEEFLKTAKEKKRQLNINFLVKQKSVLPLRAWWTSDGKDNREINTFTSGLFQDSKRFQQLLEGELKNGLRFDVDGNKHYRLFPIECGEKIPTGCELRKQAS